MTEPRTQATCTQKFGARVVPEIFSRTDRHTSQYFATAAAGEVIKKEKSSLRTRGTRAVVEGDGEITDEFKN